MYISGVDQCFFYMQIATNVSERITAKKKIFLKFSSIYFGLKFCFAFEFINIVKTKMLPSIYTNRIVSFILLKLFMIPFASTNIIVLFLFLTHNHMYLFIYSFFICIYQQNFKLLEHQRNLLTKC